MAGQHHRLVSLSICAVFATVTLAQASEQAEVERETLEAARLLAGPAIAKLPIELASVPPYGASSGVEGWTLYRSDGQGERILVYTGSRIFRCASLPQQDPQRYQCELRLASVIVHEAWHFRNGRQEAGAYTAQIAFLIGNHASDAQIAAVQMARDHILSAVRQAAKAARGNRDQPR
jgi:hypothetical protein